jgi:hypothetical protein
MQSGSNVRVSRETIRAWSLVVETLRLPRPLTDGPLGMKGAITRAVTSGPRMLPAS